MPTQARGNVAVNVDECKGCGLCVESCPPKCLVLLPQLSAYGVHPAHYTGKDCTGCGICVEICPTSCLAMGPHVPWLARPADCVSGGVCAEVCPAGALRLTSVES